jgi:hypothetical protein
MVTDTDPAVYALFDERELQGGGYTWQAITNSLLTLHLPHLKGQLSIDAEGDGMYVECETLAPLEALYDLLGRAMTDHALLVEAMDHAGDALE